MPGQGYRIWNEEVRPGHIETRTASVGDDVAWLQGRHQWLGPAAVGKITASRQIGERTSVESR